MKGPEKEFEVIVIGAGINGLTAAAYLQKSGIKVAVFERRDEAGAHCSTEEVMSPGVRTILHASQLAVAEGTALGDLRLADYGLDLVTSSEWAVHTPFLDGSAVLLHICDARKQYEAWKRVSPRDAEQYRRIINYLGPQWSRFFALGLTGGPTPEALEELNELMSGVPGMPKDWQDMNGIEVCDLMFEDDRIKTALMSRSIAMAILPWYRGAGSIAPLRGLSGFFPSWTAVGGSHALTHSLVRCFLAHGGTIYQGCPVERIIVEGGEAKGVFLSKGAAYPEAEIRASKAVVSNISCVPTFLHLVGEENLPPWAVAGARRYDYNADTVFTNFYALRDPMKWAAEEKFPEIARAWSFYFGAESPKEIERLGNDLSAGRPPDPPIICGGSTQGYVWADPSMAPPGQHTLLLWCHVAYDLNRLGGPQKWDDIREEYGDKVEDVVMQYAPNLKAVKLERYLNTPYDIVRRNPSAMKGSMLGGAVTSSQFWDGRPFQGCGAPRTPIHKLYISNSGWPPGATPLCAGSTAAEYVAKDYGVRDNQDWWVHKPLDMYPDMLAKYGWKWHPTVD